MKRVTTLIAAAVLAACGSSEDPAQKFRDAMPQEQAVRVGTPESESTATSTNALTASANAVTDEPALKSEYAIMSYYLARTVNGGVGVTLTLLRYITTFPPTSCNDTSCTWGPWIDREGLNRWRLDVQKVGDAYEYTLAGQPGSDAAAPFVTLISGTAHPADRDHGSGTFTIDFDAQDALDHGPLYVKSDFGRIVVTYDNTHDVRVGVEFLDGRNAEPDNHYPLNAVYAFQHAASGGELQIAVQNLWTRDVWSLRTRWSPSGAGRADARYDAGGDGVDLEASECWAGAAQGYAEVYDSKPPVFGEESACSPFSTASYADVSLPPAQ